MKRSFRLAVPALALLLSAELARAGEVTNKSISEAEDSKPTI